MLRRHLGRFAELDFQGSAFLVRDVSGGRRTVRTAQAKREMGWNNGRPGVRFSAHGVLGFLNNIGQSQGKVFFFEFLIDNPGSKHCLVNTL